MNCWVTTTRTVVSASLSPAWATAAVVPETKTRPGRDPEAEVGRGAVGALLYPLWNCDACYQSGARY